MSLIPVRAPIASNLQMIVASGWSPVPGITGAADCGAQVPAFQFGKSKRPKFNVPML